MIRPAAAGPRSASISISSSSSSCAWSSGCLAKTAPTCSVICREERDSPSVSRCEPAASWVRSSGAAGGQAVGVVVGMLARIRPGRCAPACRRRPLGVRARQAVRPVAARRSAAVQAELALGAIGAGSSKAPMARPMLAAALRLEGQRRAAVAAEAARDAVGALEQSARAARPGEVRCGTEAKAPNGRADGLLAHAAVADAGAADRAVDAEPHRAALAAAGQASCAELPARAAAVVAGDRQRTIAPGRGRAVEGDLGEILGPRQARRAPPAP